MPRIGNQYLTRVSTEAEAKHLIKLLFVLGYEDAYKEKMSSGHILRQLVTNTKRVSGQQSECEWGVFYTSKHDVFDSLQKFLHKTERIFGPLTIHSLFTHSVEDCVESITNRHPLADKAKVRNGVNALRRSISAGRELKIGNRTVKRSGSRAA